MSQLGSKKVCKLEDTMELGYVVKKSRLWKNEAFSKNKNYDSGFLPHEHRSVCGVATSQCLLRCQQEGGQKSTRRARKRPAGSWSPLAAQQGARVPHLGPRDTR